MPALRAKACVACGRLSVCRPVLSPIRAAMSRALRCSSSTQYMRNQLLRDADWAGMAHGVEIRLPLVDTTLLETLSAVIGQIMPGAGKLALAAAPSHPLPDEIVARAKTGFGVPTSAWAGDASASSGLRSSGKSKGLTSRRWSQLVVKAAGPAGDNWLPVSRA